MATATTAVAAALAVAMRALANPSQSQDGGEGMATIVVWIARTQQWQWRRRPPRWRADIRPPAQIGCVWQPDGLHIVRVLTRDSLDYAGLAGYNRVTNWQYYAINVDEDDGMEKQRMPVSPRPMDPGQPSRMRERGGSVVRLFRGELVGGTLGCR